jgi:hypothetical protein
LFPATPVIPSIADGVVEPRPSLPLTASVKRFAPDDEAIESRLLFPATPVIPSIADGVVEPRPSLPLIPRLRRLTPVEDATVNGLTVVVPCTKKVEVGVEEPTPTLPLAAIWKREAPEEEETANAELDPAVPRTLNVTVEEVALIPTTTPLSISVDVPRVVEVNQRVANPKAPPEIELAESPSVDVATHLVEVPVA